MVRAQSTVATDQQTLTVALTNLQLQQLLMKNALSRSLVDPALADAEVIPTSTMELPAQEAVTPTQDLVNDALSHRPELAEARINLTNHRHQQQSDPQRLCYPLWICSPIMAARVSEERRIQPTSAGISRSSCRARDFVRGSNAQQVARHYPAATSVRLRQHLEPAH